MFNKLLIKIAFLKTFFLKKVVEKVLGQRWPDLNFGYVKGY